MLKFSKIKELGKSPTLAKTAEEVEARLTRMRNWTRGPFNRAISWFVQVMVAFPTTFYLRIFNTVHIHNRDRLKRIQRPYMFVSNHLTMFDDVQLEKVD